jgi:hypothetical protein
MRQEMHGFDDGQIDAAPIRRRPRRLSQLFAQLARDADGPISLAKIRDAMGDRGFAALLVFFAAINMIPLPPGASAFLGLPLLIVSLQMVYGSKRAWLPSFLRDRSISADTFRSISGRVVPWLIWVEQMIRPRYWPFWRRRGDRVIGFIALILAIIVTLPIPLGNWLPAFSTALLGLSLIERDGILLAIGSAVGVFALAVVAFIGGAFFLAVEAAYGWLF